MYNGYVTTVLPEVAGYEVPVFSLHPFSDLGLDLLEAI